MTPYWSTLSPHGAAFIHPHHTRLPHLLRDLVNFLQRQDLTPLVSSTIPISANLLANPEGYFDALTSVPAREDPSPIVSTFSHGALNAIDNGRTLAAELNKIRGEWLGSLTARSESAAWRILDLLFAQPVVNAQ